MRPEAAAVVNQKGAARVLRGHPWIFRSDVTRAKELQAGSWAQLLLKFILAQPAVTAAIPATSNPRYMVDNLNAARGPLPDAALREKIVAAFA